MMIISVCLASLLATFELVSSLPLPSNPGHYDPFQYDYLGVQSSPHEHTFASSQLQQVGQGDFSKTPSFSEGSSTISIQGPVQGKKGLANTSTKSIEKTKTLKRGASSMNNERNAIEGELTSTFAYLPKKRKEEILKKLYTHQNSTFRGASHETIEKYTAAALNTRILNNIEKNGETGLKEAAVAILALGPNQDMTRYSSNDETASMNSVYTLATKVWKKSLTEVQHTFEVAKVPKEEILEIAAMSDMRAKQKLEQIIWRSSMIERGNPLPGQGSKWYTLDLPQSAAVTSRELTSHHLSTSSLHRNHSSQVLPNQTSSSFSSSPGSSTHSQLRPSPSTSLRPSQSYNPNSTQNNQYGSDQGGLGAMFSGRFS